MNRLAGRFARSLYVLAMYTGIRALVNRARTLFLRLPRVSVLDGAILQLDDHTCVRVRVHARASPSAKHDRRVAGMISVYLDHPEIPDSLYAILRLTSHFGCGHIELAFYEEDNHVCVFAIRNILQSNLKRIGCGDYFRSLSFSTQQDEIVILRRILAELRQQSFTALLASPEECVSLAVSPQLLAPRTRNQSLAALTRRYQRIANGLTAK